MKHYEEPELESEPEPYYPIWIYASMTGHCEYCLEHAQISNALNGETFACETCAMKIMERDYLV